MSPLFRGNSACLRAALCRTAMLGALVLIITGNVIKAHQTPVWRWNCVDGFCEKVRNENSSTRGTLDACKMICHEYGLLWPKPTGDFYIGNSFAAIEFSGIAVHIDKDGQSSPLMHVAAERFKAIVALVIPKRFLDENNFGPSLDVYLVNDNPDEIGFSLDMDESYELQVSEMANSRVNATITASCFLGVRHGLETLSQLIIFDDNTNELLIVWNVTIVDKPEYPYRGILLDTARNYVTVDAIKSVIDAMATVKLNTFHWHITDTQSFPFVSERRPDLAYLGAYSPNKVYTKAMMRDVVQFALERGVRVLPEIDAPAHVGEGWQDTDLLVCFKKEPWKEYCMEPPCGQLNPTRDETYNYLEDLYMEMAEIFTPDIFHMGGDEVKDKCWFSSEEIKDFVKQQGWEFDNEGFLQLWNYFQDNAQRRALKAVGQKIPLIMYSSSLTDPAHIEKYLPKEDYIIQMWTKSEDPEIRELMMKGYRVILSNYDALYFDCGFGSWLESGSSWCEPINWQKAYESSPRYIAGALKSQVLGGEVAMWSEQADTNAVDSRIWPKAAAFAERYWAEPVTPWGEARERILTVRERLVRMGVQADALQPEWCHQNEGKCRA